MECLSFNTCLQGLELMVHETCRIMHAYLTQRMILSTGGGGALEGPRLVCRVAECVIRSQLDIHHFMASRVGRLIEMKRM